MKESFNISKQIRENVVSLETAVSLLNFSDLAYDKEVYQKEVPKDGAPVLCSFDERYTLIHTVANENTDINMVAYKGKVILSVLLLVALHVSRRLEESVYVSHMRMMLYSINLWRGCLHSLSDSGVFCCVVNRRLHCFRI